MAEKSGEGVWARGAAACDRALGLLAAATLFFMMCVTFLDVVMRKLPPGTLPFTFPAADELTKLSLGVLIYSSLPLIAARREHLVISLFDNAFPRRVDRVRLVVIDLVSAALLGVLAWRLAVTAQRFGEFNDSTMLLGAPIAPFAWFMFTAAALASAIALVLAIARLRTTDA
jgi:TRAP-type C4-dicarboxylate transport system permease small subunit